MVADQRRQSVQKESMRHGVGGVFPDPLGRGDWRNRWARHRADRLCLCYSLWQPYTCPVSGLGLGSDY